MTRLKDIPKAILASIVLLVVAVILANVVWGQWQKSRIEAAKSHVERGQAKAGQDSAQDAIASQGAANRRETASEAITVENGRDIQNAEGSNVTVSRAASDAGVRALCRREAYRNSDRCKLLGANPR